MRLVAFPKIGQGMGDAYMLAAACMTPRTVPSEIPSSVASADGTSMMLWPDVAAAPCQATCHTDPPWLSCRLPAVAKNAHLSVDHPLYVQQPRWMCRPIPPSPGKAACVSCSVCGSCAPSISLFTSAGGSATQQLFSPDVRITSVDNLYNESMCWGVGHVVLPACQTSQEAKHTATPACSTTLQ